MIFMWDAAWKSGVPPCLFTDDGGEGVVVVDALVVLGFHFVPGHVGMGVELERDVAHEVFDEDRVFVGLHGNEPFVRPLKQGVNGSGAGFLSDGDEVFYQDEFPATFFRLGADFKGHVATLVMRSVVADFLATWAEGGDGDGDAEDEVIDLAIRGALENDIAADLGRSSGDGSLLGDEISKRDLNVRLLVIQAFL